MLLLVSIGLLLGPATNSAQSEPKSELPGLISQSLQALDRPMGFDVEYTTFEVARFSELGSALDELICCPLIEDELVVSVVSDLVAASSLMVRSVPEQLDHLKKQGLSANTQARGLLLGGHSMRFQVLRSPNRVVQTCLSDPAHFSLLRTDAIDLIYYSEQRRLELARRSPELMLLTLNDCTFPLPVSPRSMESLLASEWIRSDERESSLTIVAIGAATSPMETKLVMGGPGRAFPSYCSLRMGAQSESTHVARLLWKSTDETQELATALQLHRVVDRISVVLHEFANYRPVTDEDCVLVASTPKVIVDAREGRKSMRVGDLSPDLRKLVEFADGK